MEANLQEQLSEYLQCDLENVDQGHRILLSQWRTTFVMALFNDWYKKAIYRIFALALTIWEYNRLNYVTVKKLFNVTEYNICIGTIRWKISKYIKVVGLLRIIALL